MPYPVYNNGKTGSAGLNPSLTISAPTGIIAGNLLFALITNGYTSTSITPPSGWTTLILTNGNQGTIGIFYKITTASEPSSYTFTSSQYQSIGSISYITNVDPINPINVYSIQNNNSVISNVLAASITPTVVTTLLIFTGTGGSSVTGFSVANNNPSWTSVPANGIFGYGNYAPASATGTGTAPYSSGSGVSTGILIAVAPNASDATVPYQTPNFGGIQTALQRFFRFPGLNPTAVFTQPDVPEFTITATAGAGGMISPNGTINVDQGNNQAFTITPTFGYQIQNVIVDGVPQGAITSYTFTNVQANHAISASFTLIDAEISCSLVVSDYGYLTPTLLAAQQNYAVRPYFNAKIIDDTVVPTQVISSSMPPFSNGTSCTGPDGTVFAVGLDASGNVVVYRGANLHNGSWDSSIILVPVGTSGFFSASNRYCISASGWINGSYSVVIGMFSNFVGTSANLDISYWISNNGGISYGTSGGFPITGPTMPNNSYAGSVSPLNLCLASIKPQYINGALSFGFFFLAPNSNSFNTSNGGSFKGYDIWYTYGTTAFFSSPTFTKWSARYVNSNDWTIGNSNATLGANSAFDSFYLNGINYLVFSGLNNILQPPNIIGSQEIYNYGLFVTGLQQITGSSATDVWLPPRDIISSFAVGGTNLNSFENPSCSIINGVVNLIATATTVVSVSSSASGGNVENVATRSTEYVRMQSQDGINFTYPQSLVDENGNPFLDGGNFNSVSYVPQNQYRYLLGSGVVLEFQQNNVVADVTNDVVQYTIQETAGQPSSISLQIANQDNQWVGSNPTNPGASAISGGKKIIIQQGYYNANGVPEVAPRSVFFIDDMNQSTSSSTNTVTVTGRDFYKLMTQTVSRYAFSWAGPWSYTDIFDGTTLGNWTQVSGGWTENNNSLICSSPTGSNVITLNNVPALANSSLLQVSFGYPSTPSGTLGVQIYPYYLNSSNWVMFTYVPSSFEWEIIQNVNGSQSTVATGSLVLSSSGFYNISFRQYDFYKFYIIAGNVNEGNALEWINNSTLIGDFDFTATFVGVPSGIPTIALGCNNFSAEYQNLQYIQFNNSNNLQELLRSLAVKAGILNFDFQDLYTEEFTNPALYAPSGTATNRVLEVAGGASMTYEMNTAIIPSTGLATMMDGEIEFTGYFALQSGFSSVYNWGGLIFRADQPNGSFANAYRFVVEQVNGASYAYFERYYLGTWYLFPALLPSSSGGGLNFDITKVHQYRVVFIGAYMMAFIDGVMIAAVYDTNSTTSNYLTSGYYGYFANTGVNLFVQKANIPAFYKQTQSFAINPGDDISDDVTTLIQSASMNVAWIFSNIIGFFKALYLFATDPSTYTYQNQLNSQAVDNSDKEYISRVTVYGDGVSATAVNTNLMVGVATREAVVVDYTILTQQDAQTAANNYILNQNQYQNQYSPSQTMNVGSELFDVVTIVDTGNNTSGVNGPTRIYAETFTVGGGQNTSNSIQIETGNV